MAGLKLIQIEGIGPVYTDKLLKVGIETTDELFLVDPRRVAKRTGIPYTLIEAWQEMADLLRILGVGPEYAEALNNIGIDSCPELAQRDPESTLAKLKELVEKTGIQVIRRLPTLDEVKDWINQAKILEPLNKLPSKETDPFDVPLNVFKHLDIDQIDALYQLLHEKHGDWIRERLKESNAQFIVICDQKVVLTSNDPYGPPAEKVKELANQFGKACYTVGGEILVEEVGFSTPWIDLGNDDYYPTLEVYLGNPTWSDEEAFTRGIRVVADFDTGNPNIHVFNQDACRMIAPPVEWWEYKHFLGEPRPQKQ